MRYFELATQNDTDPYFAQFTDDATVEDEGVERHGIAEIRAWRTEVPKVAYDVQNVDRADHRATAEVAVTGDFPGSPVSLVFHFEYAEDNRIRTLRIRS